MIELPIIAFFAIIIAHDWPLEAMAYLLLLCIVIVIGLVTWFIAWLGAGQVPLINLTQLILWPRHGYVSFERLLKEALDHQLLRQAGAVYQFRHAAFQAHLADGQRRGAEYGTDS
jgi:uncharacterized membrane protein YphA (DoxX/SURF4 family)